MSENKELKDRIYLCIDLKSFYASVECVTRGLDPLTTNLVVADPEREHRMQKAMLEIKEKFGKNAILKGMNLEKGATTRERNRQIGGHKSGV